MSHQLRTPSLRFGPLTIEYDDSVLAPRAWTEWQGRWAAQLATTAPDGPILELCCGAGQIGLLAAVESGRDLVAVDLSGSACGFAVRNAAAAGLEHRVEVRQRPLASACAADERFPIVVADPPWVSSHDTGRFPEDPLTAIDGGADGLDVARACLLVIEDHLAADGVALLQVGSAAQVSALSERLAPDLDLVETRYEPGRGAVMLLHRRSGRALR